jgi:hypothetical protein
VVKVKKIGENITVKDMMDPNTMTTEEYIAVVIVVVTIFPTIIAIVNGEDGVNGIVTTKDIQKDIQEDIIIMTDKETSCFRSVRIPKIAPRASRSDSITNVPCYKCLVFVMCKDRMRNSVVGFAQGVNGCPEIKEFVLDADQDDVNNLRKLFGLEPYP